MYDLLLLRCLEKENAGRELTIFQKMNEKRKSFRERYFEDYETVKVPADNRKGYRIEYRYIGKWIQWRSEKHSLRQTKVLIAAAEIISIVLYCIAILSGSPVTVSRFANGFGTLSFVMWILELGGAVRFIFSGKYSKELEMEEVDREIRSGTVLRIIFVLLSMVSGVADVIGHHTAAVTDIPVVISVLSSAFLSFFVRWLFTSLLIDTYKNHNGQPGNKI